MLKKNMHKYLACKTYAAAHVKETICLRRSGNCAF